MVRTFIYDSDKVNFSYFFIFRSLIFEIKWWERIREQNLLVKNWNKHLDYRVISNPLESFSESYFEKTSEKLVVYLLYSAFRSEISFMQPELIFQPNIRKQLHHDDLNKLISAIFTNIKWIFSTLFSVLFFWVRHMPLFSEGLQCNKKNFSECVLACKKRKRPRRGRSIFFGKFVVRNVLEMKISSDQMIRPKGFWITEWTNRIPSLAQNEKNCTRGVQIQIFGEGEGGGG